MLKKVLGWLKLPALLVVLLVLASWGRTGHRVISFKSFLSFNNEMQQFSNWVDYLVSHSSDPDSRRSSDPTEAPKHYIDIDNYPEFVSSGKIEQDYNTIVAQHGYNFVIEQGILPWTTLTTLDSLKACFSRRDWQKAEFFVADLGHYIADGHMPFHITRNYNGQFTGNTGIHGRYESDMINNFENDIVYSGQPAQYIENPSGYIFNYLYKNYTCVDSVLQADNHAKTVAGNTSSDLYYQTLWNDTRHFTTDLFKQASFSFASLIYTAWTDAGKPQMNSTDIAMVKTGNDGLFDVSLSGFFSRSARISYQVTTDSVVVISVYDVSGNHIQTLASGSKSPGFYSLNWKPEKRSRAMYFIIYRSKEFYRVKKVIL